MSTNRVPDQVIDQLRGNLRAAGITVAEADIQGIVEKGFLSRLADIERAIAQAPIATIASQLRARQVSPVELTEQALTRIAERDPELNAFQLVLAEPARAAA